MYVLTEFIKSSSKNQEILYENVSTENGRLTIQEIAYKMLEFFAQNFFDRESGLISLPPYQTWMIKLPRIGAAIEITSMLYSILSVFSSLSEFPQKISLN